MTTIAIFFQQSWSIWMEKSAEVDPLMSFIYYFMTVILGSFCLLNLTVATVGQNYSRVKEEATRKKDLKIAEQARKDKIQAERDEMKKMAQKDKEGDGNEDDGDDEIIQLFDTTTAYKYWIFGLVGLTFLHRYYFKLYNVDAPLGMSAKSIQAWPAPFRFSIFWFIFRCLMEGDDDLPSQGDSDDFSDVDDENDEDKGQGGDKAKTQSHFAWFADFVVVANAMTLAMEGFDDSIQIYLDMVGYLPFRN